MIFTTDLGRPEGPVVLPDGSILVVEMAPERGCVSQIAKDGKSKRVVARTGRPNGLAVDRNGVIWVAESVNPPSLLKMTLDGKFEVFLKDCNGEPFLFPNDLAFGPDGALYMTDSGYPFQEWAKRRAEYKTIKTDGRLYRIDTKTRAIAKLDSGFRFTNGIAFGPDKACYVNESITGNVWRFPWNGSKLGRKELFGNVVDPKGPDVYKGPDGMKFATDGNLYVTVFGQGDVTILDRKGGVVKRLPLVGKSPTNIAFGLPGSRRIFVTEQAIGQIEAYDVGVDGLPLYT